MTPQTVYVKVPMKDFTHQVTDGNTFDYVKPLTALVFTPEEFEAEKLKWKSEWIDVREGLPKVSAYYLIFSTAGVDKVWYNHHGEYFGTFERSKYLPTHWMPLPTAPGKATYISSLTSKK